MSNYAIANLQLLSAPRARLSIRKLFIMYIASKLTFHQGDCSLRVAARDMPSLPVKGRYAPSIAFPATYLPEYSLDMLAGLPADDKKGTVTIDCKLYSITNNTKTKRNLET